MRGRLGQLRTQEFHRHLALEILVLDEQDFAHPAFADRASEDVLLVGRRKRLPRRGGRRDLGLAGLSRPRHHASPSECRSI
jgi:hypothetical protein